GDQHRATPRFGTDPGIGSSGRLIRLGHAKVAMGIAVVAEPEVEGAAPVERSEVLCRLQVHPLTGD
ncbi:hypothetical protein, partial [Mycobacterium sp.]|uniref:hypothetical protein n=1 Tax=Mycobacterium sp. TaxID=1785 RepID=UPI003C73F404